MCVRWRAVVERSPSDGQCARGRRREEETRERSIPPAPSRRRSDFSIAVAATCMKAMVVSPVSGRVPPNHRGVLHNGLGIGGARRDLEAEEVAAYLTKLRSLVPDMPRKRKLSKLEVIQRVIEYICDLQTALEETNAAHQDNAKSTTTTTTAAAAATTTTTATSETTVTTTQSSRQPLQPLLNATASTTTTSVVAATVADR